MDSEQRDDVGNTLDRSFEVEDFFTIFSLKVDGGFVEPSGLTSRR